MNAVKSQRGSMLVITAILIIAMLGFGALAIDAVYLTEVRSELQNTADAAALAGTSGFTVSQAEAAQRTATYTALNPVLGQSVDLAQQEAVNGQWNDQTRQFIPGPTGANSVRVTLRLTDTSTPTAPALFFAPILGEQTGKVTATSTATLTNRNVMITLDRSGSMAGQPLADTKVAAKSFVDLIQNDPISGDLVGLVYFSGTATLNNQLTDQYDQVKQAIDVPTASGWTNIAAGLCKARRETRSSRAVPQAVKVIILLSDGKTNTRIDPATCELADYEGIDDGQPSGNISEKQAIAQAKLIAQDRTVLYAISLGSGADRPLMKQMATITGGEEYYAPTAQDLQALFTTIASKIPLRLVQ